MSRVLDSHRSFEMPPGVLSSSFMNPGSSVKVTALALMGLSFEFGVDTKREDVRVGV